MLLLTRYPGQTITIGDDIFIHIVERQGNQIRIGITAPREIPVHRQEIKDIIDQQKTNG